MQKFKRQKKKLIETFVDGIQQSLLFFIFSWNSQFLYLCTPGVRFIYSPVKKIYIYIYIKKQQQNGVKGKSAWCTW